MIKNKDGSYNKFSLLILSAIIIITIGMVISLINQSNTDIEMMPIAIIGAIISGAFILYYIFKSLSNKKIISDRTKINDAEYFRERIDAEIDRSLSKPIIKMDTRKEKVSGEGIGIVSIIVALVIGAVTMIMGLYILNSLTAAMPELPEGSYSTAQTQLTSTVSSAFNIMPLLMFIGATLAIISMTLKLMRDVND